MQLTIRLDLSSRSDPIILEWNSRSRHWLTRQGNQLITRMRCYYQRSRQRHALRSLTDDQLKDIGRTRIDAMQEAAKPFWRE